MNPEFNFMKAQFVAKTLAQEWQLVGMPIAATLVARHFLRCNGGLRRIFGVNEFACTANPPQSPFFKGGSATLKTCETRLTRIAKNVGAKM